jgi:phosphoribosylformimino-5-aminoimidazole carboxamide ribotide isomerase
MARRIADPSFAHDGGNVEPASPPPVTHSWTRTVRDPGEVVASMSFEVIPVLDIRHGQAVHAVAGPRAEYQPLRSILHPTSDPTELGRSLRETLGLQSLYVADLDAIEGACPQLEIYRRLTGLLSQVWIDAGIRGAKSAGPLFELERSKTTIVVGLETIGGPEELAAILARADEARVVFSLDLDDGRPRMAAPGAWSTADPVELSRRAIEQGVKRLLILDLSRIGTGRGTGTKDLMTRVLSAHPAVDVFVGGGISTMEEISGIRDAGSRGVLIGSALHDGRVGTRELAQLGGSGSLEVGNVKGKRKP